MGVIPLFSTDQVAIIEWAAVECRRQRSGELSVAWMLHAWEFALVVVTSNDAQHADKDLKPTEAAVLEIGRLVEPRVNARGYRECGVRVGADVKMDWRSVPRAMENLIDATGTLTPDEWFYEFEDNIHPFRDGNGRSGSILWNWLRGTLAKPEEPPEFWGPREVVTL